MNGATPGGRAISALLLLLGLSVDAAAVSDVGTADTVSSSLLTHPARTMRAEVDSQTDASAPRFVQQLSSMVASLEAENLLLRKQELSEKRRELEAQDELAKQEEASRLLREQLAGHRAELARALEKRTSEIKQEKTLSQEREALHRGLVSLKVQQEEALARERDMERRESSLLARDGAARQRGEALNKREQTLNQRMVAAALEQQHDEEKRKQPQQQPQLVPEQQPQLVPEDLPGRQGLRVERPGLEQGVGIRHAARRASVSHRQLERNHQQLAAQERNHQQLAAQERKQLAAKDDMIDVSSFEF